MFIPQTSALPAETIVLILTESSHKNKQIFHSYFPITELRNPSILFSSSQTLICQVCKSEVCVGGCVINIEIRQSRFRFWFVLHFLQQWDQ